MKQNYESEVLFQLMERDGLNIPSSVPPYEATSQNLSSFIDLEMRE